MFREFFLVRFSDNLSVMLASGVPIVSSLQVLGRSMVNVKYQQVVQEMSVLVQQGVKLSDALSKQEYIGHSVAQLVRGW